MAEKPLTVNEVADRLCLSEVHIRRLLRDGKIKGFKRGLASWGVRPSDLKAFEDRETKKK